MIDALAFKLPNRKETPIQDLVFLPTYNMLVAHISFHCYTLEPLGVITRNKNKIFFTYVYNYLHVYNLEVYKVLRIKLNKF